MWVVTQRGRDPHGILGGSLPHRSHDPSEKKGAAKIFEKFGRQHFAFRVSFCFFYQKSAQFTILTGGHDPLKQQNPNALNKTVKMSPFSSGSITTPEALLNLFSALYRVLLGFTGSYRVFCTRVHRVFPWFYIVYPGGTWFYMVLHGFTGFHLVLLGYIWFYRVLTRIHWDLVGLTGFDKVFLGFTGF